MTDNLLTDDDAVEGATPYQPLVLDPDEFRSDLAEFNWTEEQENAFLATFWEIASTFVLMGWNADIVQILFSSFVENSGQDSENLVDVTTANNFNDCAEHDAEKASDDE